MTKHFFRISIVLGLLFIPASTFAQDTMEAAPGNSQNDYKISLLQFKTPHSLEFCGEHVPLERRDVWERLDKQFLFALNREAQVIMWISLCIGFPGRIEESGGLARGTRLLPLDAVPRAL